MNIIVTADKRWAIGSKGQPLVSIPADFEMFREDTKGKVVVMGRKTVENLPGGQPIPGRMNIVLSQSPDYRPGKALVAGSLEAALKELEKYPEDQIFIAGGAGVYRQFLPYCQTVHVTRVDYEYSADTYFPDLDADPGWRLAAESEEQTFFNLCYCFQMYRRVGKNS